MAEKIKYPQDVIEIAKVFRDNGHKAYAVGGCVRDSIMGRVPSDWDITTDARPERMIEICNAAGLRFVPTGLKHGTITVIIDKKPYECTTFRIDGDYTEVGLVFEPNRAITKNEAARIISGILGLSLSEEDEVYLDNPSVSQSARASVSAMFTLGIFDGEIEEFSGTDSVTRADAAEYLYRM